MNHFIDELPRHYQRSPQEAELQRVLEALVRRAEADQEFTLAQLFPGTASGWGLELWERAYGLSPEAGQTEAQRRAKILAKIKGTGTSTLKQLQDIAACFSPGPVEVTEQSGENRFTVCFVGTIGEIEGKESLTAIINERKPAHLAWDIKYRAYFPACGFLGIVSREAETFILRQER